MGTIYRAVGGDEFIKISVIEGRDIVETARQLHHLSPTASAALGRTLCATSMMGDMMKEENAAVTARIEGGGHIGCVVAVSDCGGNVRGYVDHPDCDLPLRPDGKLDVGGAVGHEGRMSVMKDLGIKKSYIGQSEIVSGEIAMDFAHYFTVSEQQPSLVALGVLVGGERVIRAGGLLIQPLPGCPDEVIDQLELRSPMFADISREMTFAEPDELCGDWFRGLEPRILERTPLAYRCTCSRERMEKALISIGKKDLESLIAEDQGAELSCHFCHNHYFFTTEQLREMLRLAQNREEENETHEDAADQL